MAKSREQPSPQQTCGTPRSWQTADEFAEEAQVFLDAAQQFIGRGELPQSWCESQRLRMRLAYVIESADYTESWQRTLQHMLRLAEGASAGEHRRLAVQAVQTWGGSWKLPAWQASSESRRACLSHLVGALRAFDTVFARLSHDLDTLAVKLDAYTIGPASGEHKSAQRILAELIVEGADALGFAVEPREPMLAEVLRIERQLTRDCNPLQHLPNGGRASRVMQTALDTSLATKKGGIS